MVWCSSPALVLNGLQLERVTEFKYLGVHISSNLSWSPHVDKICSKTRKLVGMIHRRFYSVMDTDTSKQLYTMPPTSDPTLNTHVRSGIPT